MKISRLVAALEASATLAMAARARQLRAEGHEVYDLSLGEPDQPTPEHICEAAIEAIRAGHTHYTPAAGIPELRAAVARDYHQRHGIEYKPNQVIISNGAKHSVHNALTTLLDPGDEVIIPAPYWVSYAELVKLAGGVPRIVPTREADCFKLSAGELKAALSPRSKVLLVCSPSNPTGATYTSQQLAALADVIVDSNLNLISDEIYERLVYGNEPFRSFPTLRPELVERTVLVGGVSKTYAMTGWRIGWTLSPANLAQAMGDLQSQQTSNPSSISQYAALAALTGPQECVEEMRAEYARRREFVLRRVAQIPGIESPPIEGAFYTFLNVQGALGRVYHGQRIDDSQTWCQTLLDRERVALVAGSAFGAEGYARMSFAAAMPVLEAALAGMERFVRSAT